jgi:K319L-like, PKD domain/Calx-beta domain
MSKRPKTALAVLALAAAAVFVLPASSASAGSATVSNACANSVTPNFSQIEVTTSGDDGLALVNPAGATSTTVTQSADIPGAIFVAGYNLGLLQQGVNNIPANVQTKIEGTNTAQGTQTTNTVGGSPPNGSVTVTTTITDPDGTPGTGDETATPASFSVTYDPLNWTASGPDGSTIDYRQESIATSPPTAANNTLLINALIAGFLNVQFRCAPGTVTPPDPGTITLIDPAASFDTTAIEAQRQISIDDVTVGAEGDAANFTVSLNQPSVAPVTVDFATADGSAMAPGDYTSATGTVTFAPGDTSKTVSVQTINDPDPEGAETFNVNLSNPMGNAAILDGQGVGTIPPSDEDTAPTANAGADQTVDELTLVQLDGTGSSDPQGEALTYAWSQLSGPAVTLSDPTSATPTFTAPDVTGTTTLEFRLDVCDEANPTSLCDPDGDTVVITVQDVTRQISINDASATEGGAVSFTVSLDAPSANPITVDFVTADGTAMAPGDYTSGTGTVTFAPGDTSEPVTVQTIDDAVCEPVPETFNVNLSNNTGNSMILDGLGVGTINDNELCPDAAGEVIVNGPVKASLTSKVYVFRVSNVGTTTFTIDPTTEIDAAVLVNGIANGSVSPITGTKTISPGARARFRLRWTPTPGTLVVGDTVSFTADVNEPGDIDPANDADSQDRIAG